MSLIKKLFIFGVILPVLSAFLNYRFSSITLFEWGHVRINEISIFAFSLAIFFCIFIIILNYKNSIKNKALFILPGLLIVIFLFYIYTIYSLSSFGF